MEFQNHIIVFFDDVLPYQAHDLVWRKNKEEE